LALAPLVFLPDVGLVFHAVKNDPRNHTNRNEQNISLRVIWGIALAEIVSSKNKHHIVF
jgi:hypothetical protein